MAEYINRLQLVSDICTRIKDVEYADGKDEYSFAYGTLTGLRMAMKLVNKAPTADVVPKSEVFLASSDATKKLLEVHGYAVTHDADIKEEVVREIFEEIEREINDALQSNYKVLPQIEQSEALWNRVNGKIDALRGIDGFITELREKYKEGNNNDKD